MEAATRSESREALEGGDTNAVCPPGHLLGTHTVCVPIAGVGAREGRGRVAVATQFDGRETLLALFRAALDAVAPAQLMPAAVPEAEGRLVVLAVGKAAGEMMRVAQARGRGALDGLAVVPVGHIPPDWEVPAGVEVILAGHPVPDAASVGAAERALALAEGLGAKDHLLVLLSGGGSALLAAPAPGVSLADKQAVTRALLRSGAAIGEINVVRKHLSRIKGGRLALAAAPARVTTWILSDVPGDDPALVASGPTVGDSSSLADARAIVARCGLDVPASVSAALEDPANETPSPDHMVFERCEVRVIGRARDALDAAAARAEQQGFEVVDLGDALEGEARRLGAEHAALARRLAAEGGRRVILSGGETSVVVTNPAGRGGRNLEYLLGLAIALDGAPGISALACDTDGIDGTGDAAGAIVRPDTLARARALGADPDRHLARNDAYTFFEALGDLVVTGPTLTNVNDFRAILVEPPETAGSGAAAQPREAKGDGT